MSTVHYNWKRFWCPRNGFFKLSDNGFLYDPESEFSKYYNSDVFSFENISLKPCLVLLGEPGIGKSTTLEQEFHALNVRQKCFYKNLGEYGDESRLINEVFKSTEIEEWLNSDYVLNLFLDSLDECKIKVEQVGLIFKNQFEKIKSKLNRLHLRIACRTADFPSILDNCLPNLWGKDNFGVYEMVPLRRKDVEHAAGVNSIESKH
ncbi:MAG: hypothetical protein ABFD79_17630, partial [Phycisphaerales bacterium]